MPLPVPTPPFECVDQRTIDASPEACFSLLLRIREYGRWWRLVRIEPVGGGELLGVGSEFDFVGRRRTGRSIRWRCAVRRLLPPRLGSGRIDLEYTEGDLNGPTGWEIDPDAAGRGSIVRYVYRGVRAMSAESAVTFEQHGTDFHSHAMQHDALAGIARVLGGPGRDLTDEQWDAQVRAAVAAYSPRSDPQIASNLLLTESKGQSP